MMRPKKDWLNEKEIKQTSLYIPKATYERMRNHGFAKRLTYQDILRTALEEYLDKYEKTSK